MSIADEISAATTGHGGCTVTKALDSLDPEVRAEFEAALASDAEGAAIARVLSKHSGKRISPQTLNRHRRDGCACGRS